MLLYKFEVNKDDDDDDDDDEGIYREIIFGSNTFCDSLS